MFSPFKPSISLDAIYVSPLRQNEEGLYEVLSLDDMQEAEMPKTGSLLLDALAEILAKTAVIGVQDVAEIMQVDYIKLSNAVVLLCDVTLKSLLCEYRMRQVKELIQYTQLSIEEVAKRCGYASASSLSHILKTSENTTFLEYRSQFQKRVSSKIVYELKK